LQHCLIKLFCAFAEKYAEKADIDEGEDKPCTRCGKSNQPEWVYIPVTSIVLFICASVQVCGFIICLDQLSDASSFILLSKFLVLLA